MLPAVQERKSVEGELGVNELLRLRLISSIDSGVISCSALYVILSLPNVSNIPVLT